MCENVVAMYITFMGTATTHNQIVALSTQVKVYLEVVYVCISNLRDCSMYFSKPRGCTMYIFSKPSGCTMYFLSLDAVVCIFLSLEAVLIF